jgi:hypothetical protein
MQGNAEEVKTPAREKALRPCPMAPKKLIGEKLAKKAIVSGAVRRLEM